MGRKSHKNNSDPPKRRENLRFTQPEDILCSPLKVAKETFSQAAKIFYRFEGPINLHRALTRVGLKVAFTTVYRWGYPKHKKGTSGMIPARYWPYILKAAVREGILLTSDDFDPRNIPIIRTYRPKSHIDGKDTR